MNGPGADLVGRARELLESAFGELDRVAGALSGVQHSAALDARQDVAHALRQVRALGAFLSNPPARAEETKP